MCNKNKNFNTKFGIINGYIKTNNYNEKISTDIYGPFPMEEFKEEGKGYILTIIDIFSRLTKIYILEDITTVTITNKIEQYLIKNPSIKEIISDQGKQYISIIFSNMLNKYNIKHTKTTAYNPTSNGISERINYTIGNILRIYKGGDINNLVEMIELNLNGTYHQTLKATPYEVAGIKNKKLTYLNNKKINIQNIKNNIIESANKSNIKINKNRIKYFYKIDDMIYTKNIIRNKLDEKWLGPFKIIKIGKNENTFKIDMIDKVRWTNLKQIRPSFEGAECHGK